jgi:cobalt-zinc-cadmium efflux system outer membrane protein
MRGAITYRYCACSLMLVCSAAVWGQSSGDRQSLGLPEAVTRTLEMNPYLIAQGLQIPAAEGRLLQAEFAPRPELGLTVEDALGTDRFRAGHSAEVTVTLGWILERGARQRIVEAARADVSLSMVEIEILRLDTAAETARRFLDCLAYQARLVLAREGVELAQDAVAAVRRRIEASRAPEAELARAEAALVRAELRQEDYEHELLSAYHRLSAQWGETEPRFDAVDGSIERLPSVDPIEELLARVENNPDFARFASEQRLHEAELELARSRSRPAWRVATGLRRIEASDDFAVVGSLTVPLRMGNQNQGRIAEARADLEQTTAEAFAARVNIETELFVLYQELRHNIQLAERLQADVAPRLESALADMRRAFELGRSSYLELRAVQAELLDTNNELLEARVDAQQIVIEIERLTGERIVSTPPTQ